MAPFNIHVVDWHARQLMLLYIDSFALANQNTYCSMNTLELSCATPFPFAPSSAGMQHCPRRPCSQSCLIICPQTTPNLQLSTNSLLGSTQFVYLLPYSVLLHPLTPGEQNLYFLSLFLSFFLSF